MSSDVLYLTDEKGKPQNVLDSYQEWKVMETEREAGSICKRIKSG